MFGKKSKASRIQSLEFRLSAMDTLITAMSDWMREYAKHANASNECIGELNNIVCRHMGKPPNEAHECEPFRTEYVPAIPSHLSIRKIQPAAAEPAPPRDGHGRFARK